MTRRYLITGGTSGIGRNVATHLTSAGHAVWITGAHAETLASALDDGVARGGSVAEVTDWRSVDDSFAAAADQFGGLDGAFLNAGIDGEGAPAELIEPAHFARVLAVNVTGVMIAAQAAYRTLARPGSIVVNASVNAVRPEANFADYNASKAAALSIAKSLALEWSSVGLSVTSVCPGYFPSRMTEPYLSDPGTAAGLLAGIPAGRFGSIDDIGHLLEFLLGPHSAYLTGASVAIDGGRSI